MTRTVLAQKKPLTDAALQSAIVAGDGIIINGVPGTGTDPFSTLLVGGLGIGVEYNSVNRQWTITATLIGGGGGGGGFTATHLSTAVTSTTVTIESSTGDDAVVSAATGSNAGIMTAAMFSTLQSALQQEFETVAKNLKSYPATLSYTGDRLDSIVYTLPSGTITKTLNYTGEKLTSVVLSGSTPSGIELTKTLSYTGDNLTGVAYS